MREALVRTHTRYASLVRTLTRRDGLRLPTGDAAHLSARLAALELSDTIHICEREQEFEGTSHGVLPPGK